MSVLSETLALGRFLWGLPGYHRWRITSTEARAIVRERIRRREANFLGLLERFVFGNRANPYARLLELARCQPGDVRQLVEQDGVDAALRRLREAGVYLSFEEFKSTGPIVRQGVVVAEGPDAFVNPTSRGFYRTETGGSTGSGRQVQIDIEHLVSRVPHRLLSDAIHGMLGLPSALWFEPLPGNGPQSILLRAPFDAVPQRWFAPILAGPGSPPLKYRLANRAIVAASRVAGIPFPRPEYVPLDRADIVAQWAATMVRSHGGAAVFTHPSKAVRVALAARERGLDLTGTVFSGGGEPVTHAKVAEIERAGARFVSGYIAMETGTIGMQCARATDPNDQHFFRDHLAVIQHPREIPAFGVTVDTFHFTTLLPSSPRLLLNVELDDYGVIESRSCGCGFEQLGFSEHISDIRSFRKLTGEGMTLVGTEVDRILEAEMPTHCGGSGLDYQLVEEEDERGLTRLVLTVSARVPASEEVLHRTMLDALARGSTAAALAGAIWAQGSNLLVRRAEPEWTQRGKRPLFRPLRRRDPGGERP